MNTKLVAVLGAGVMGTGVAQNLAQSGHQVILLDLAQPILLRAKGELKQSLRMYKLLHKETVQESTDAILNRITFTTDYALLKDTDFVIENVVEKWEVKEAVYQQIDPLCPPHCIFLVNTSCISITKIAALTKRPSQVIGTHFMNPVPLKTTIEAIRGYHTSEETIEATKALLASMGKQCILVNDLPGFVSNRLSHLLMNEAAFVVQDQVASPQQVDDIFKQCFGHTMGPLESADLIGLDTVVDSLDVLYQSYQDPKFRCCPLLRKMVEAGLFGRKSGQGFYQYS